MKFNSVFPQLIILLILASYSICDDPSCPLGQYRSDQNICKRCPDTCIHCTDETNCLQCIPGYGVSNGHCVTFCPDNEYAITNAETKLCKAVDYLPFTTVLNPKIEDNFVGIDITGTLSEFSFCLWFKRKILLEKGFLSLKRQGSMVCLLHVLEDMGTKPQGFEKREFLV